MKIKNIIFTMAASLSLPLAGANARVALPPDATDIQSGSGAYLPGQATDEQAMDPTKRKKKAKRKAKRKAKKRSKRKKKSKSPSKKK